MKQNINRRAFFQISLLPLAKCLEDSQTLVPPLTINPFDETEVQNELLSELLELSTNEELKMKFTTGFQTFWLVAEVLGKYIC
nr:unnamed protein product [Callosobruchus analis]